MDDRRRAFAAATALCFFIFFFTHGVKHTSAGRPLATTTAAPETAWMEVPTSSSSSAPAPEGSSPAATWQRGGGDEGKWLPLPVATALAGGLRFPGVLPLPASSSSSSPSLPWLFPGAGGGGAPPAAGVFAGPGMGMPAGLVPPYVGATRQEQLSVWASLFNPFQVRPRLPAAEASSSTTASTVPAVASGGVQRTTTVDEPAGAQPKWGVFLGTTTQNNNG